MSWRGNARQILARREYISIRSRRSRAKCELRDSNVPMAQLSVDADATGGREPSTETENTPLPLFLPSCVTDDAFHPMETETALLSCLVYLADIARIGSQECVKNAQRRQSLLHPLNTMSTGILRQEVLVADQNCYRVGKI